MTDVAIPLMTEPDHGRGEREVDELLAALQAGTVPPRWPWAVGGVAVGAVAALIATSVFGGSTGELADTTVAELVAVDIVSTDMIWTIEYDATLGFGETVNVTSGANGTVTSAAEVGATLRRGDVVGRVDDVPVVLWYGKLPDWRDLSTTSSDGRDVLQVETNLRALGFDPDAAMTIDEDFTSATSAALARWQEAVGLEVTSAYGQATVVFAPGPVTVTQATASGNRVTSGGSLAQLALQSVVDDVVGEDGIVTSPATSAQSLTVAIDLGDADDLPVGRIVDVELADGTVAQGEVVEVGTVASNRQGAVGITVTIGLVGDVDTDLTEGPAVISFLDRQLLGVTAVPVRALITLAEGGYALEVVAEDGSTQLVAVEIGDIQDGLVVITNGAVQPGQRVAAVQ